MKVCTNGEHGEMCDECATIKPALVLIGQPPDYYSSTAYVCRECLLAAATLLDSHCLTPHNFPTPP